MFDIEELWRGRKAVERRRMRRRKEVKRRRKSPKAKGKEVYRKGLKYERDVKKLLLKKGYKSVVGRYRPKGTEVDLIMRKEGKLVAIEAKSLRYPIGPPVVNKLKKTIDKSQGIFKGGVIVSRKGATEEAKRLARKSRIQIIKYAGARRGGKAQSRRRIRRESEEPIDILQDIISH